EDAVKISIPKILYMDIVKIQASENLSWEDACQRAAERLDRNSEDFKKAVEAGAETRYKSRFMTSFNKSRSFIVRRSRLRGYSEAMKIEHFSAPCSICGIPVEYRSTHNNWNSEIKPRLSEAFKNYYHITCLKHRISAVEFEEVEKLLAEME
ncbi:MAG: hypothetical protein V1850_06620, partial [Candidatus Bathyarchaeota archaeon]